MKYIVRSILFNDYFVGIEPMKNNKFKLYWSQFQDEAQRFDSVKEADKCLVLIHGLIEDDLQLSIIEVREDDWFRKI